MTHQITMERFRATCGECGERFEVLARVLDYGTTVLQSTAGRFRLLDAFTDPVYEELRALVESVIGRTVEAHDDVEMFHRVVDRSVDVDEPGERVLSPFDEQPCPKCGGTTYARFGPFVPGKFTDVPISPVTHEAWSRLSEAEKRDVVRDAMRSER